MTQLLKSIFNYNRCPFCDKYRQCDSYGLTGKSHLTIIGADKKGEGGQQYKVNEWGYVCRRCYTEQTISLLLRDIQFNIQEIIIRIDNIDKKIADMINDTLE